MQKIKLKHYAQGGEKKPCFPRLYLVFQNWTFINVQISFPFLLLGKNIEKDYGQKGATKVTLFMMSLQK